MSNREIKLQELAGRIVDREIYYCVSSMMYSVGQNLEDACEIFDEDYDETMSLFVQDDWEEPVTYFIRDNADLEQLEQIADEYGYWSDITNDTPEIYAINLTGEEKFCFAGASKVYDDEDDAQEAIDALLLKRARTAVEKLVEESSGAYEWVGREFSLDPDQNEVYEHWIVSEWLAKRLEERDHVTGTFAGLTIWGRCTTGQSISMDYVIQKIAAELWPEELK